MCEKSISIFGILNVTPDSFSDGGKYTTYENARIQVDKMISDGADYIDVGGESSRHGSQQISAQEEIDRVVPIIEMIRKEFDCKISIDTYKSSVAFEACAAGAMCINDISGFNFDSNMINVAKKFDPLCILMHNKGNFYTMHNKTEYFNITEDVREFLSKQAFFLKENGINKIILDPGFGFAKNIDDNYSLLKNIKSITEIGYPVLAGISRKSMIGGICSNPPDERISGSIALQTIAILNGATFLRVHDVAEAKQAIMVTEKYLSI